MPFFFFSFFFTFPKRNHIMRGEIRQNVNTNNCKKKPRKRSQKKQRKYGYKTVWFCNTAPLGRPMSGEAGITCAVLYNTC